MSRGPHDLVNGIVASILDDYDGLTIDIMAADTQQLWSRLARTLHAAINGELETELPLESANHPELFEQ